MAKITFGASISDARNKCGGIVYSRARGVAYQRAHVIPTPSSSATQLTVRGVWIATHARWNEVLTEAQRLAWNALAALKPPVARPISPARWTGHTLYCSANQNVNLSIGTWIDDPIADQSVYDAKSVADLSCDIDAGELWVAPQVLPPAGQYLWLWVTTPRSLGTYYFDGLLHILRWNLAAADFPFNAYTEYVDRFGPIDPNTKIGVGLQPMNSANGVKGVRVTANCTVQGTGDAMLHSRVVLNDTDIKDSPTNDKLLLAGTPGKITTVHKVVFQPDCTAGAYTNVSGTASDLAYTTNGKQQTFQAKNIDLFNHSQKRVLHAGAIAYIFGVTLPTDIIVDEDTVAAESGTDLKFGCFNTTGNLTGGNAANTLTVDVYYSLADAI